MRAELFLATKGGLLFGAGGDTALYAFDKASGKELWHADLTLARPRRR
jgi:outer membrane protein assembly factor BamB